MTLYSIIRRLFMRLWSRGRNGEMEIFYEMDEMEIFYEIKLQNSNLFIIWINVLKISNIFICTI